MKTLDQKAAAQDQYRQILAKPIAGIGATKVALRRFLKSIDLVGWSRREESGRLDRRALTRYALGDAAIFSRRERTDAETSAVSILIDVSGSTANEVSKAQPEVLRIQVFAEVAVHLTKLISDCGTSVEVNGFSGSRRVDERGDLSETVEFFKVKGYNESQASAAPALASIPALLSGSTPDYSALRLSIEALDKRTENRKILFVITDADDYQIKEIKHLDGVAKKLGIIIVAIGVGTADITKCFTNAASVTSAAEVFTQSFNKLLNSLKG